MRPVRSPHSSAGTIAPSPPVRRERPPRRRGRDDAFGPPDGDQGDGGRGGDGGGGDARASGEEGDLDPARARLGLYLALFGMSTLFAAFLIAYLLLRRNATVWPPPGAPVPPKGLWMSTLVLAASSATFVLAARAGRARLLRDRARWLAATLALGVAFLVVQAILWKDVFAAGRSTASDAYGTIFYSLTGLHAAHVVGGLVFLARTGARARRDPLAPRTELAFALCSTYWHFMGAVWVVLFGVLYFLN